MRTDSQLEETRDELVRKLDGRPIDFLMIDGDHSEDGVRRDFELYGPLVAADGLIALHDILPHPEAPECRVDVFWNEVKTGHKVLELVHPQEIWGYGQWGGIGVIFAGVADRRASHDGRARLASVSKT